MKSYSRKLNFLPKQNVAYEKLFEKRRDIIQNTYLKWVFISFPPNTANIGRMAKTSIGKGILNSIGTGVEMMFGGWY